MATKTVQLPAIRNDYLYKICLDRRDYAGKGPVDTSAPIPCDDGTRQGGHLLEVNTLPERIISPFDTIDQAQSMYAIFGWPMDRLHIFLEWVKNTNEPVTVNTQPVTIIVQGGCGNDARKICLQFNIKAQPTMPSGRLITFTGRLYERWEFYAFGSTGDGANQPCKLKLRMLLDRIGSGLVTAPFVDPDPDFVDKVTVS